MKTQLDYTSELPAIYDRLEALKYAADDCILTMPVALALRIIGGPNTAIYAQRIDPIVLRYAALGMAKDALLEDARKLAIELAYMSRGDREYLDTPVEDRLWSILPD